MDLKWDKETDVLVVGYGLSGAVAAIEAHDSGVDVLVLEKSKYPGGCSILSAGQVLCADNYEAAYKYLSRLSGGRVELDLIRTFAQGLVDNERYLRRLSEVNGGKVHAFKDKGRDATYPFEGRGAFYAAMVQKIPGFEGDFPWLQRERPAGVNLMKTAIDNVESRNITVLLSSPAKRLIADASGCIIGVISQGPSGDFSIGVRRAVILACGGFEQNQWLQLQFLQGKPFYSMAPLTHTGDGIMMAQKVGAALWHMWHVHGSYGFKFPEFPTAFRISYPGPRHPRRIMPWIMVDKFGRRYMNEYPPAPQDTGHRPMELFDPDMPGYPRIPSYLIFDEVGRKRGPIAKTTGSGEDNYEWSKDNLEEVSKRWIISGNSIEELGVKIKELENNEGKMDPQELKGSVNKWIDSVRAGKDPFNRPPGTMLSIEHPPFYAVPVWPIITNTQGGPEHNAKQQVIDPYGKPIPHLYSVGELGSFFGHLYQLQGNLGECLLSGRIAGREAAAEAP